MFNVLSHVLYKTWVWILTLIWFMFYISTRFRKPYGTLRSIGTNLGTNEYAKRSNEQKQKTEHCKRRRRRPYWRRRRPSERVVGRRVASAAIYGVGGIRCFRAASATPLVASATPFPFLTMLKFHLMTYLGSR